MKPKEATAEYVAPEELAMSLDMWSAFAAICAALASLGSRPCEGCRWATPATTPPS